MTGASGLGKTTLLRVIAGLAEPDAGTMEGAEGQAIGMAWQEDRLLLALSPLRNLAFASDGSRSLDQLRALLVELGLGEALDQPCRELSGGMRRRVALARALAVRAGLVLLDEPFQGLDPETRAEVMALCRRELEGRTALIVSHEADTAVGLGAWAQALHAI